MQTRNNAWLMEVCREVNDLIGCRRRDLVEVLDGAR